MKKMVKKSTIKKVEQRDQYTVVLEDLRSNFKAFGENLSIVRDKVEHIDLRLARVEEEVLGLRLRLGNIETSNEEMKTELGLIRHNQVTRDELKYLETRVLRLEKAKR